MIGSPNHWSQQPPAVCGRGCSRKFRASILRSTPIHGGCGSVLMLGARSSMTMTSIFASHCDIVGDDYAVLIRAAGSYFDSFTLAWPSAGEFTGSLYQTSQDLRGHELGKEQDMTLYRLDAAAVSVLLRPRSLFSWRLPEFPKDLTFYRAGRTGFTSSADHVSACILDAEFLRALPPQLGFVEERVPASMLKRVV